MCVTSIPSLHTAMAFVCLLPENMCQMDVSFTGAITRRVYKTCRHMNIHLHNSKIDDFLSLAKNEDKWASVKCYLQIAANFFLNRASFSVA